MPEPSSNNLGIGKSCTFVTQRRSDEQVDGKTIFMRNFLLGGFSAAVAVTAMAPIERVKLILQVQNASSHVKPEFHYKGLVDCFVRIQREQGFSSFWRGNLASVLRSFSYQAFNFAFKDKYKDIFVRNYEKKNHFWRRLGGNLLSGGIAGATSLTIIYPLDYARTRLAMDQGAYKHTREFKGITSCLVETYKMDGLYGLYRGFYFSLFGVFIYRAGFFGLYDTGRDFTPDEYKHMILVSFLTAEVAATTSGLISYPMDTIRRSMMMQSARVDKKLHYTSSFDCIKKVYKTAGVAGFFNGAFANILRGTGGAIILCVYNEMHHKLWGHHGEGPDPEQLTTHNALMGTHPRCNDNKICINVSPIAAESKTDDKLAPSRARCDSRKDLTTTCETCKDIRPVRTFEDRMFHFCDF